MKFFFSPLSVRKVSKEKGGAEEAPRQTGGKGVRRLERESKRNIKKKEFPERESEEMTWKSFKK